MRFYCGRRLKKRLAIPYPFRQRAQERRGSRGPCAEQQRPVGSGRFLAGRPFHQLARALPQRNRQRIPMPTYPFKRERHWLTPNKNAQTPAPQAQPTAQMGSNFAESWLDVSIQKRFSGNEFFIADHVIGGQKMLPGVAYLQTALELGSPLITGGIKSISDVIWSNPLVFQEQARRVRVTLEPSQRGRRFQITTAEESAPKLLAQGCLNGHQEGDQTDELSLPQIEGRCSNLLKRDACYTLFRTMGFQYGPEMQPIQWWRGNGHEALARFGNPKIHRAGFSHSDPASLSHGRGVANGVGPHGLRQPQGHGHLPALFPGPGNATPGPNPFLFRIYPQERRGTGTSTDTKSFHLTLADENGTPLITMKDLAIRCVNWDAFAKGKKTPDEGKNPLKAFVTSPSKAKTSRFETSPKTIYYLPSWEKKTLATGKVNPETALVIDENSDPFPALDKLKPAWRCILLQAGAKFNQPSENRFQMDFKDNTHWLRVLRALQERGITPSTTIHLVNPIQGGSTRRDSPPSKSMVPVRFLKAFTEVFAKQPNNLVSFCREPSPLAWALSSFYRTLHSEMPELNFKVVQLPQKNRKNREKNRKKNRDTHFAKKNREKNRKNRDTHFAKTVLDEITEPWTGCHHLRYQGQGRQIETLAPAQVNELQPISAKGNAFPEKDGVYWITGGGGALGLALAHFIAARQRTNLVLIGRSPLNSNLQDHLDRLHQAGTQALYLQADVTSASAVEAALKTTRDRFRKLAGIFHCAGTIKDRFFLQKTLSEFETVIQPKLQGALVLERLTRKNPKPFLVLFSSLAAVVGNPGQSDYAFGNGFLDGMAEMGNQSSGQEAGRRILSYQLRPLWKEGAMTMDTQVQKEWTRSTGMEPLESDAGFAGLETLLASPIARGLVLSGDPKRIAATLIPPVQPTQVNTEETQTHLEPTRWRDKTETRLLELFAQVLQTKPSRIDPQRPFGEYGVDSFVTLRLIKSLEKDFGALRKTLLFELGNVEELAAYLVENHQSQLKAWFNWQESSPVPKPHPRPTDQKTDGVLIVEQGQLSRHPQAAEALERLLREHASEGSISRGTQLIAPHLFFLPGHKGVFHFGRSANILLAYAFSGPESESEPAMEVLANYCAEKQLQLNLLSEKRLEQVGSFSMTATPFGVIQRIENLAGFHLGGRTMRRLRYLVGKFEKQGTCRTVQYRPGGDAATDRAILEIIDAWCAQKTQINPLVHQARNHIETGQLYARHRLYLTYLNETLQNAILITPMAGKKALMDLEFYGPEMPLGGLEFAIWQIIQKLTNEGFETYSLGGTYGPRLAPSPNADPEIEAILDRMRQADDFGKGNVQFKDKFRPTNTTLYLCRPQGSDPQTVTDILMMIADPQHPGEPAPMQAPTSSPEKAAVSNSVDQRMTLLRHHQLQQPGSALRPGSLRSGDRFLGEDGSRLHRSTHPTAFPFKGKRRLGGNPARHLSLSPPAARGLGAIGRRPALRSLAGAKGNRNRQPPLPHLSLSPD